MTPITLCGVVEAAFRRRERRAGWLYGAALALHALYALSYASNAGEPPAIDVWLLLIPALVMAAQILYPTVVGWVLVLVEVTGFAAVYAYYLVANELLRHPPQSAGDAEGAAIGVVIFVVLVALAVALVRRRPWIGQVPSGADGARS